MKKLLPILIFSFIFCQVNHSQTLEVKGKPVAEIFTDFHCNLNDTTKTTGFGLNRAFFGYNFLTPGNFSGLVIINVGSPDELPAEAVHRRYAYFRVASMTYSKNRLNLTLGITSTGLTDFQQKFLGKRYVANTFQGINGYGYVADLGVSVDYKFDDIWKCDFTVMNGEGYSELQCDNGVKASAGMTITPNKQLAVRLYGDINKPKGIWQYTLIWFTGFRNELVTIGVEADYKSNIDMIEGHHSWGISGTGGVDLTKEVEVFMRYDYISSLTVTDKELPWNYLKDGSLAIVGAQYTFSQNVKIALNYQGTYPYDQSKQKSGSIYLNALFRF
ncbi:MAG: hypothetical protein LLG13_10075 [Bacteroidales bacterium]|nr:hypothetical protein [Bacteroidales bacterium]